jgi:hypothetical protein
MAMPRILPFAAKEDPRPAVEPLVLNLDIHSVPAEILIWTKEMWESIEAGSRPAGARRGSGECRWVLRPKEPPRL